MAVTRRSNIYCQTLFSSFSMRCHHAQVKIPGSAAGNDRCATIHRYCMPSYITSSPIWYSKKFGDHIAKPSGLRDVVGVIEDNEL